MLLCNINRKLRIQENEDDLAIEFIEKGYKYLIVLLG